MAETDFVDKLIAYKDDLYERQVELFEELSSLAQAYKKRKDNGLLTPVLVDIGFLLREIASTSNEIRKQAQAHSDFVGTILCKLILTLQSQVPGAPDRAKGTLASAKTTINVRPFVPDRDTPEWNELCDYFNIPPIARGVVKFGWEETSQYLVHLRQEGKNPPMSIMRPGSEVFGVRYRRKTKRKSQNETDNDGEEE